MNKLKPELNLNEIGYFRFTLGIAFGIAYGIISTLWFLLIDKAYLILFDLINQNVIQKTDLDLSLYNGILTGTTCAALGFCFTMYFWTSRPVQKNRKRNLKMRVAHTNGIFMYMLILFVFTKFLTFDTSLKYDGFGPELKRNYGYLPFSLPIFIFLFNWLTVGRIYKSGRFMVLSAISVLIFGIIMGVIIT